MSLSKLERIHSEVEFSTKYVENFNDDEISDILSSLVDLWYKNGCETFDENNFIDRSGRMIRFIQNGKEIFDKKDKVVFLSKFLPSKYKYKYK